MEAELPAVVDDYDGAPHDSLPVPAVVGIAMSGATRSLMRALPPSIVA